MNIPILLTVFRLAAIPILWFFYFLPISWGHAIAAMIFIAAALTYWLDGHLARLRQETSEFGAFLDPVADKLLVSVVLVILLSRHNILGLTIPAAIIIGREITVSALR